MTLLIRAGRKQLASEALSMGQAELKAFHESGPGSCPSSLDLSPFAQPGSLRSEWTTTPDCKARLALATQACSSAGHA